MRVRQLDRAAVNAPGCLANYQHGMHNWDNLSAQDRAEIRQRLEQMQGRRCAYCEGSLDVLGHHIEHFRRKHAAHFPQLTFVWANLYLSCDQQDSCGHYKDHGAGPYNVNDLVDPCVNNPDVFFRFRSDGTISVRSGLQGQEQHRAQETLRVFNLNPQFGRLRAMRRAALAGYIAMIDDAAGFTADELRELFSEELAQASCQPFSTAIRHVLTEP